MQNIAGNKRTAKTKSYSEIILRINVDIFLTKQELMTNRGHKYKIKTSTAK